ncbi:ribonuclease H-like domain-containing protein [Tanacetum coccineum]
MITRSQSDIVKPIDRLSLNTFLISPIPKNLSNALKDFRWSNTMYDKYNALVKSGTWLLVSRPASVNMVRSIWLFKHKFHADGTLSRYKYLTVSFNCHTFGAFAIQGELPAKSLMGRTYSRDPRHFSHTNKSQSQPEGPKRRKVTPLPHSYGRFPRSLNKKPLPQEEGDDPDLELAKKMSLEAHQEKGEGEGDDADMERAIKLSLDPAFLPQGRAPVGGVTIRDPVSETTPKLPEVVGKGKAIRNQRTSISFHADRTVKEEKKLWISLSF